MKALSLYQPWASLMAQGIKRVETRSWGTPYRGRVAICAARKGGEDQKQTFLGLRAQHEEIACRLSEKEWEALPFGGVLAVADLVECRSMEDPEKPMDPAPWVEMLACANPLEFALGDYGPGRFGWFFANLRLLAVPFLIRGNQRLWMLPDDIARKLEQLA